MDREVSSLSVITVLVQVQVKMLVGYIYILMLFSKMLNLECHSLLCLHIVSASGNKFLVSNVSSTTFIL